MRIFFIDEHNSSKNNGIGTFRDQLLPEMGRNKRIRLTLISLNSDVSDMHRQKTDFGTEFQIPPVDRGNWRDNGGLIWPVLRTYINDTPQNIFIVNHSPCAKFISELKEMFPLSKVVFVIHDQGWTAPLLGNAESLRLIVEDNAITESKTLSDNASIRSYYCQERDIYNLVDSIVCLSPSTHRILEDIYKIESSKIHCIPNGYAPNINNSVAKADLRKKLGLGKYEKVIIFAGRPAKAKGIEAALMALRMIRNKYPQVRCVFCGKMDGFAKYSALIKPVASMLTFTGQLDKSELYEWYAASDVGLLPSYTEQCSYSAIEMVMSGLPVVTTDGNGLCDMFTDGKNAFVAAIGKDNDIESFSHNLAAKLDAAIYCADEKRKQLISDAQNDFSTRYAPTQMISGYLQVFKGLL